MRYEIILFDADDTLFDFKKSEREAFKKTMLDFGSQYEEAYHFKVYQDINTAIWKEFEDGLISQTKLKVERFKRLSDKLQMRFDEAEFAKTYMRHLSFASFLLEDSVELVEKLSQYYKLFIITNGLKDVQENRIRKSDIAEYFEDVIISEEVGVSKPNPGIFEIALDKTQCTDKRKILMVGDSLTSDIQGGINFGIDTCWYNPQRHVNHTGIRPTYEISNLLELNKILDEPDKYFYAAPLEALDD